MATITKPKAQSKQKKSTVSSANKMSAKKTTEKKHPPTEEQIRQKAQEIYEQRNSRGEFGTAIDDWRLAEKLLSES